MTARDDYPLLEGPTARAAQRREMLDEIDRLKSVIQRYSEMLTDLKVAEIQAVADSIANGVATCGATWRDTEATGWLWYCSLPVGHAGHHRCIGATW